LYDAEGLTLWKVDQKSTGSSKMWSWRRMGKISFTDRVRNEEVLHTVKGKIILNRIKRSKGQWIDHILRRNCLIKHVIEGKIDGRIQVTGS
jgi:hypothetical protein